MSPYLFVLAMEAFSMILNKETLFPNFKFHWKTESCNISHVCFADDIILFCHGDLPSVSIIHSCLQSFSMFSGSIPNALKSLYFLANVPIIVKESIRQLLGIPLGVLPIRFLRVPLISSKLSYSDCQLLIQRIIARVSSWTSCFFSYFGRVQLIKSVLFAIQSYWVAHFILPKSVLRSIQTIMCRFLWKGSSLLWYGSKVSWKDLSLPLCEGGLAIKNLTD